MLTNLPQKKIEDIPVREIIVNNRVISSSTKIVRNIKTQEIISFLSRPHRDIIFHLVKNSRSIISRKELKCVGWQGKKVSNSSVLVAISEIRRVIGDEKIMTVTGEGYMYVG